MGGADEQLLHKILVPLLHAGDAPAAPLLQLVQLGGLALDIAEVGQGNDALLLGDQILNIHLPADLLDLCPAIVAEPFPDLADLLPDDGQHPLLVPKDCLEILDLQLQSGQLIQDLLALHAGQLAQLHGYNGIGLGIVNAEPLHQPQLGLRPILGGTDDGNHFVHKIDH